MRVANPVMDILNPGGTRASTTMGQAGRALALAGQSFNRGASMALKIDQVLQEQENRLYNRQQQAQESLNKIVQQQIDNNFKERQAAINEDANARANELQAPTLKG